MRRGGVFACTSTRRSAATLLAVAVLLHAASGCGRRPRTWYQPTPGVLGPWERVAARRGPSAAPLRVLGFGDPTRLVWRGLYRALLPELDSAADLQLLYLPLPRAGDPQAERLARVLIVAEERGRFWDVHERLCLVPRLRVPEGLPELARLLRLQPGELELALSSASTEATLALAARTAALLGVGSQPAVLVNGRRVGGAGELEFELAAERAAVARLRRRGVARARIAEQRWHGQDHRAVGARAATPTAVPDVDPVGPAPLASPATQGTTVAGASPEDPPQPPVSPGTGPPAGVSPLPIAGSPSRQAADLSDAATEPLPNPADAPPPSDPDSLPPPRPVAPVALVCFADLASDFYVRLQPLIEDLLRAYPRDLRYVLKHFPQPHHPRAALFAEALEHAREHERFWELHDGIVIRSRDLDLDGLLGLAMDLGLDTDDLLQALDEGRHRVRVQRDHALGLRLEVRTSPTCFLDGERLVGLPELHTLHDSVRREVGEARRLMANGVPAERVHAERARQRLSITAAPAPAAPHPEPAAAPGPEPIVRGAQDPAAVHAVPVAGRPSTGASEPIVTVVQFVSYGDPFSVHVQPAVEQLLQEYQDELRLVVRHAPLAYLPNAGRAARVALAAAGQGRFWEVHRALLRPGARVDHPGLMLAVWEVGLDPREVARALQEETVSAQLSEDQEVAARFGVSATPAFFVDGRYLGGARPLADLKEAVEAAIVESRRRMGDGMPREQLYARVLREGAPQAVYSR